MIGMRFDCSIFCSIGLYDMVERDLIALIFFCCIEFCNWYYLLVHDLSWNVGLLFNYLMK